jgi:hypothetical protein
MKRLNRISTAIEHPLDYLGLTGLVETKYQDVLR